MIAASEDVIVIPAPVLSEIIVKIPTKTDELLKLIRSSPWFKIEGFDAAAATELGLRTAKAMASGDKREGMQADWTKVKFDRQIVAIALVIGASEIISDDADVAAIGERWGIRVRSIEDLPIPNDLIPPPLIAAMQDQDIEPQARPDETIGRGQRPQAETDAEKANSKEAGKN